MPGRLLAAFCVVVLLLVPAVALAQSAGDEQYSDPFAGKAPVTRSPAKSPASSPTSPAPTPSTGAPVQGSSGQLASSAPTTANSNSSSATSTPSSALPRTGLRAWLLAVAGALMLLVGAFMRLGLRSFSTWGERGSPQILGRDVRLIRRAGR